MVSVLMPAYNCEKYIRQAIESILSQTHTHIELLIADDGSKDNTKTIIDSYTDARVRTFHNPSNLGYLKTCNKLFAIASGDFVTFQDADDYSDSTKIEKQLKYFAMYPETGAVGTNMVTIDQSGNYIETSAWGENVNENLKQSSFHFCAGTFMIRKEVLSVIGGYNEYFDRKGFEDYYWTMLIAEKYPVRNLSEAVYYRRINPESVSQTLRNDRKSFLSHRALFELAAQRKATGTDMLQSGKQQEFTILMLRKLAAKLSAEKNDKEAIKEIGQALKLSPLNLQLYRDLIYFTRKIFSD
ncbi:MAG: glycosyltransferase family 2 protein [Chitinophagales bacterium]|nr:glycosyltransferase family 2 protein [Chitinophagales bacterium]